MLKKLASDEINDIAILQTSFGYHVRYGLQSEECPTLQKALVKFAECQRHALTCEGHLK